MYAIVSISGKQYRVEKGDKIRVDLLSSQEKGPAQEYAAGAALTFKDVLLTSNNGATKVGQPLVAGASVSATVVKNGLGTKLWAFKRKRRKGFHKTIGHRQPFTEIEITGVTGA